MSGRFDGKVAIVTGAGGGIGREHARLFAAEGAAVLVNDTGRRTGADAASVVAEIEAAGGRAVADTNSATWDGADTIVQHAVDAFGRVDVLVNNATAARNAELWKVTEAEWDLAMDVNLKGYFAMIRAAAPHFCRQSAGVIVNTSSGSGFGHPSAVAYASAKEGVVGLTRTVAKELGRFGVRCNAIRPLALGVSTREYTEHTAKWATLMALTMNPRGAQSAFSAATPETHPPAKISPLVVWLCTDAARGVNGRTFHVAGDTITRLSEPAGERVITQTGGWTLDDLDRVAPVDLVGDLTNDYLLDDHPELQAFEG
ncbi:MAG TPA: SDR family NAD(P)-dependent oxidoreductase [Acidimicrobiia bacterium]|nr:SDR family NAD(P)-dependent oxidoreductase [Acidimicrobiia bacterium]